MNPSVSDFTDKINFLKTNNIILLPNNKNVFLSAQKAASKSIKNIKVVETYDQAQGLSALLNFNSQISLKENFDIIKSSLELVKTFSVSMSIKDTKVDSKKVRKGEFFSISRNKLISTGKNADKVVMRSIEQEIESTQLVTLYSGENISLEENRKLGEQIKSKFNLEVGLLDGGQPHYHYIVALE